MAETREIVYQLSVAAKEDVRRQLSGFVDQHLSAFKNITRIAEMEARKRFESEKRMIAELRREYSTLRAGGGIGAVGGGAYSLAPMSSIGESVADRARGEHSRSLLRDAETRIRTREKEIAVTRRGADEHAKAEASKVRATEEAARKITKVNRDLVGSFSKIGESIAHVTRGLALFGLQGSEAGDQLIKGLMGAQAAFDLLKGGAGLVGGIRGAARSAGAGAARGGAGEATGLATEFTSDTLANVAGTKLASGRAGSFIGAAGAGAVGGAAGSAGAAAAGGLGAKAAGFGLAAAPAAAGAAAILGTAAAGVSIHGFARDVSRYGLGGGATPGTVFERAGVSVAGALDPDSGGISRRASAIFTLGGSEVVAGLARRALGIGGLSGQSAALERMAAEGKQKAEIQARREAYEAQQAGERSQARARRESIRSAGETRLSDLTSLRFAGADPLIGRLADTMQQSGFARSRLSAIRQERSALMGRGEFSKQDADELARSQQAAESRLIALTRERWSLERSIADERKRANQEAMTSIREQIAERRKVVQEERERIGRAAETFAELDPSQQRKYMRLQRGLAGERRRFAETGMTSAQSVENARRIAMGGAEAERAIAERNEALGRAQMMAGATFEARSRIGMGRGAAADFAVVRAYEERLTSGVGRDLTREQRSILGQIDTRRNESLIQASRMDVARRAGFFGGGEEESLIARQNQQIERRLNVELSKAQINVRIANENEQVRLLANAVQAQLDRLGKSVEQIVAKGIGDIENRISRDSSKLLASRRHS